MPARPFQEAVELLRASYQEKEVLKEGSERITVTLMIPRVRRVVVLRQDTPNTSVALVPPEANDEIHRGSGEVIDLPIYENDVLHALGATGGLPGTDAAREIYVIRREAAQNAAFMNAQMLQTLTSGQAGVDANPNIIRIPLAVEAVRSRRASGRQHDLARRRCRLCPAPQRVLCYRWSAAGGPDRVAPRPRH